MRPPGASTRANSSRTGSASSSGTCSSTWLAMSLGVMLVIIGLQFLVFGLLAEVLARTYYESQDKKIYTVRRISQRGGAPTSPTPELEGATLRRVANGG